MKKFVQALSAQVPAIAVPLVATDSEALLQAAQAVCESDAQVAEWRLDAWPTVDDDTAAHVFFRLHQAGKMVLVTIRTKPQGGAFGGDTAAYVALYRRILDFGPDAIDIEANIPPVPRQALVKAAHASDAAVVASQHDFHQTPGFEDGQALLQSQSRWGDVVKLAAMPQQATDTLNLLALLAWAKLTLPQPAIIIGMGELGQLTRVASGAFAPGLTFATLGAASAPGQLSVATILQLQGEQA